MESVKRTDSQEGFALIGEATSEDMTVVLSELAISAPAACGDGFWGRDRSYTVLFSCLESSRRTDGQYVEAPVTLGSF